MSTVHDNFVLDVRRGACRVHGVEYTAEQWEVISRLLYLSLLVSLVSIVHVLHTTTLGECRTSIVGRAQRAC